MKHNILLSALLAAMLVIAGCGGGGSSDPQITGTTMAQLDKAVMELDAALKKAEDATTPTNDQIEAIKKEYMELRDAIQEAATGVNTDDAQKLLDGDGTIKSYTERLAAIKNKQTAATSTSTSTSTGTTGTTTNPGTTNPDTDTTGTFAGFINNLLAGTALSTPIGDSDDLTSKQEDLLFELEIGLNSIEGAGNPDSPNTPEQKTKAKEIAKMIVEGSDVSMLGEFSSETETYATIIPADDSISNAQKFDLQQIVNARREQLEYLAGVESAFDLAAGTPPAFDILNTEPEGEIGELSGGIGSLGNYRVVADASTFGYWLKSPTIVSDSTDPQQTISATYGLDDLKYKNTELRSKLDEQGRPVVELVEVQSGLGISRASVITTHSVTATYAGEADGYAVLTHATNPTTSGEITASVNLEVTFGDASEDPNRDPSIAGMIDDFKFIGQKDDLLKEWQATLSGTWGENDAFNDTVSSGASDDSEWSVVLYTKGRQGTNAVPAGDGTPAVPATQFEPLKDNRPTNALGHFDLTFDNGRAVGAFDIAEEKSDNSAPDL